jgi:hypothetical protein
MNRRILLWLDDYRDPMQGQWLVFSPIAGSYDVHWVKSYNEFKKWIKINGLPTAICFDHDLGTDNNPNERTGYHAAKWLIEYCIHNSKPLPLYNIQSSNPVGKENIDRLLKNFIKQQHD